MKIELLPLEIFGFSFNLFTDGCHFLWVTWWLACLLCSNSMVYVCILTSHFLFKALMKTVVTSLTGKTLTMSAWIHLVMMTIMKVRRSQMYSRQSAVTRLPVLHCPLTLLLQPISLKAPHLPLMHLCHQRRLRLTQRTDTVFLSLVHILNFRLICWLVLLVYFCEKLGL